MTSLKVRVTHADTLDELAYLLNNASKQQIKDLGPFIDRLPFFDDDVPRSKVKVWSWDATRALVLEGGVYVIVPCRGVRLRRYPECTCQCDACTAVLDC
jgi:hypothetical protein